MVFAGSYQKYFFLLMFQSKSILLKRLQKKEKPDWCPESVQ